MTTIAIKNDLLNSFDRLSPDLQLRVVEFVKALTPKGTEGKNLLRFGRTISDDDLSAMAQAIAEGCEKVDAGEW